jgi:hypothetical protein
LPAGAPFLPLTGGTVTGNVNLWPTGNGQVNIGLNHVYTGAGSASLWTNVTQQGSITDNGTPYSVLTVVQDSVDATGAQGGGLSLIRNAINLEAGARGGRTAFGIDFRQNGATNINAIGQYYVALSAYATASYSAGGTSGAPLGILFGAVDSALLRTGATFWDGVCGYELDVGAQSGASVAYKQGMKVVLWNTDAVAGSQGADFCYSMNAMSGFTGPGWNVGYCFGSPDGVWPINPTSGTLIGTVPTALGGVAYAAMHGVDFSAVTFSQDAFKSNNFRVDGAGNIASGQLFATGGTLSGGLHFGATVAPGGPTDLSRHIELYGGGYAGFSITSNQMNYVISAAGGAHVFYVGGATPGYVGSDGINNMAIGHTYVAAGSFTQVTVGSTTGPTWTTGSGVPSSTQPVGSLYSRVSTWAAGATLYVSKGAGAWTAVASV